MQITSEKVISEIAAALEISLDRVGLKSTSSDLEEWDSLGHLSILSRLDSVFDNVTEKIPELASAGSVEEIVRLLNS